MYEWKTDGNKSPAAVRLEAVTHTCGADCHMIPGVNNVSVSERRVMTASY